MISQAPFSSPSLLAAETSTSVKKTSCRWPSSVRLGMGVTVIPGEFIGVRKIEMSFRPGPVRASRKHHSAL